MLEYWGIPGYPSNDSLEYNYYTTHNWLEMQKVVTFVCFLMEHPVFIMYIEVMCMTKEKKKKNFFLDMLGSEPAATSITNFGEFSVLYSGLKSTKKSTCIKGHPYIHILPFYEDELLQSSY